MQTLTASETIQSISAAYSKESFVTAHSKNTPKTHHVDFAHFGPVSSDHPRVSGSRVLPAWAAHCLTAAIVEDQRWNLFVTVFYAVHFQFTVALASDQKAASFTGRWLTTERTHLTFFLIFAWKEMFTLTVAILVSFTCLEDFCMLAVISVYNLLIGQKDLLLFYSSCWWTCPVRLHFGTIWGLKALAEDLIAVKAQCASKESVTEPNKGKAAFLSSVFRFLCIMCSPMAECPLSGGRNAWQLFYDTNLFDPKF